MTANFQPHDSGSLIQQAQQLSRTLHNLLEVLRSQREILRQRGLSLPTGVLTLIEDIQIGIQELQHDLKEDEETLLQFRALTRTAALVNSTLDLDHVLNQAMDTVIQLTGAERGYLMLRNEDTGELEYRVARNLDRETIAQDSFMVSRSVVNHVAESGEPVVTTNAQNDPRFASQESIVSFALRSILCVPLKVKEEIIGAIYADNRIRAGLFGDSELAMLNAFASQAAVAIENARMFARISGTVREINEIRQLMDDVFASIPSGVIVTDSANQIQTYNTAAEEILSLSTLANTPAALYELLGDALQRLMTAVRAEKRRGEVELVADVPARGQRHLNFKLNPLRNAEQATEGLAIVLDDLTEVREHEAQLNLVRRYLPPAMVDNIESISQLGLGGMRREITVVYVDVRPIATLPDDLSPRQQMEMLNRYMAVASDAIHRYGGVIDKYMGTEVMALFNTQLNPSAEHAGDALRAALEMAEAYTRQHLNASDPASALYYRIGIHSGVATLGNVGSRNRREFTALGDTVNLAHRLLDMASTGEVLVSHDTFAAATSANLTGLLTDRGECTIRGRAQPVRIYQLQCRETH